MNLKQIINDTVQTDWKDILLSLDTESLDKFLTEKKETFKDVLEIFPPDSLIFNAFNQFDIKETRIIIICQDPFINKGEAMGYV